MDTTYIHKSQKTAVAKSPDENFNANDSSARDSTIKPPHTDANDTNLGGNASLTVTTNSNKSNICGSSSDAQNVPDESEITDAPEDEQSQMDETNERISIDGVSATDVDVEEESTNGA
jgi:hypothetical protein